MEVKLKKVLLCSAFVILFVLVLQMNVYADDRTVVSYINATSDYLSNATYGSNVVAPKFTVTSGSGAYFEPSSAGGYYKIENGSNKKVNNGSQFTAGTYFYKTQVRIDGASGKLYVLSERPSVYVNGGAWTLTADSSIGDTFSYVWVKSPEFTITQGNELAIGLPDSFKIEESYVNHAISTLSVSEYVVGGTKPYTYSITSGPSWINISSSGVISGTPTMSDVGYNSNLVIRVTDKTGSYKEATIKVAKTIVASEDKTVIKTIYANSDYRLFAYVNETVSVPNFTVTGSNPARFEASSTGRYVRKTSSDVVYKYGDKFLTGTHYYKCQIRLDGDAGLTYKFGTKEQMKVVVEGVEWNVVEVWNEDDFSIVHVRSPYFNIDETSATKYTITFNAQGGSPTPDSQTVIKGMKASVPKKTPSYSGKTFDGWWDHSYSPARLYNFEDPVNGNITLYAHWIEKEPTTYWVMVASVNENYGKISIDGITDWTTYLGKSYEENSSITINAQPAYGYEFVRWDKRLEGTGEVVDSFTEQTKTVTVTGQAFYRAIFHKIEEAIPVPDVMYQVKIKNEGSWKPWVKNGETAMRETAGNLQQAMRIDLSSKPYSGSIEYRVHVENIGWMDWVKDGEVAGIENTSYRTEALQIRLTDELADHYDIYYRTHVENNGWMSWARNGEASGSSGAGYRIEGIQIKLVEKGSNTPEYSEYEPDKSYPFHEQVNVIYMGHIENKGDVGTNYLIRNGVTLGYPNQHLRMEGLKIFKESTTAGTIEYTTHVQNVGWLNEVDGKWNTSGEFSGRKGQGLRVEGIKIRLTDDLASKYSVYYRVKVENQSGWQGWAKDGQEAGSMNHGLKLEAIQIKILVHGDPNEGNYKPNPDPMLK